jgi:hypothetical protein
MSYKFNHKKLTIIYDHPPDAVVCPICDKNSPIIHLRVSILEVPLLIIDCHLVPRDVLDVVVVFDQVLVGLPGDFKGTVVREILVIYEHASDIFSVVDIDRK